MSYLLTAALAWADDGYPVFPCHNPVPPDLGCSCGNPDCGKNTGKHPRTPNGCLDATHDPEQIEAWWRKWPDANIGIATGEPSGVWVLDVDGDDGAASLAALEAEHGPLPPTMAQTTGRGRHLFFQQPVGRHVKNRSRILPGLDARGTGGYVLAAPSLHLSGSTYTLMEDERPAEAPEWLLDLVAPIARPAPEPSNVVPFPPPHASSDPGNPRARVLGMVDSAIERIRSAPEGSRNDTVNAECYNLGGYLDAAGVAVGEVLPALESAARDAEQQPRMVRRALEDGRANPRGLPEDSEGWHRPPMRTRQQAKPKQLDEERAIRADRGADVLASIVLAAGDKVSAARARVAEVLAAAEELDAVAEAFAADPDHAIRVIAELRGRTGLARSIDEFKARVRDRADQLYPERTEGQDPQFAYTDLGNAERFDHQHGNNVRWCAGAQKWLTWDSRRWEWDEREAVHALAQETIRRIGDEVTELEQAIRDASDADARERAQARRDACAAHALASQGAGRINAVPSQARALPGKAVSMGDLDRDPWLFNARNCTFDLRTGTPRPQQRSDLITQMGGVPYIPDARAPTWEKFLAKILPDGEVRAFLRRSAGYCLTGDVSAQKFWVLLGDGANGKSTFLELLMHVLGGYSVTLAPAFFEARRDDPHPTEVAKLKGHRFAAASEVAENKRLDEGKVKRLTGGDTVTARHMNEDWFDFEPTHKLWLATNHRLKITGTDYGIWRRILTVQFEVRIPDKEQDLTLKAKLLAEAPGILNWMLQGLAEWRAGGLQPPKAVIRANSDYQAAEDVIAQFLEDCTEADQHASESLALLYNAYTRWFGTTNNPGRPITNRRFSTELEKRGYLSFKHTGNRTFKRGLKVAEG